MFDTKLSCVPHSIGGCYLRYHKNQQEAINFWRTTLETCKSMPAQTYKKDGSKTTTEELDAALEMLTLAEQGKVTHLVAIDYAESMTNTTWSDEDTINTLRLTVLDKHLN